VGGVEQREIRCRPRHHRLRQHSRPCHCTHTSWLTNRCITCSKMILVNVPTGTIYTVPCTSNVDFPGGGGKPHGNCSVMGNVTIYNAYFFVMRNTIIIRYFFGKVWRIGRKKYYYYYYSIYLFVFIEKTYSILQ
jgi:hypothetical protein